MNAKEALRWSMRQDWPEIEERSVDEQITIYALHAQIEADARNEEVEA